MSLRAAVIGVGYLGRFHAQKYKILENVELVAVSDVRAENALNVAKELGVEAVSDFRQLKGKIDMATIATTTGQHYDVAKWCLQNGISILLEKPMTVESAQAEELCHLAEANQLLLQTGFVERYNKTYLAAKDYIQKPTYIDAQRLHPYTRRGADVSVILDLMIHDLDMILFWAQSPLKSLQAHGERIVSDTYDVVHARLEFETGMVACVMAARTAQSVTRKVRAWGPKAYVTADLANHKVAFINQLTVDGKVEPTATQQFEKTDALLTETKAFVDAVSQKSAPVVSGRDGVRVQKLCDEIAAACALRRGP